MYRLHLTPKRCPVSQRRLVTLYTHLCAYCTSSNESVTSSGLWCLPGWPPLMDGSPWLYLTQLTWIWRTSDRNSDELE